MKFDKLRDSSLYTQAEAAAYLNIPKSTLRYWAFGYRSGARSSEPILRTTKGDNKLSFFHLVELHVLSSIRDKIDLKKIRKALEYTKKQLGSKRPLLEEEFETDGVDLFIEKYGTLINISKSGQEAMRSILKNSLQRIKRDQHKIPVKLYPYTHSNLENSPKLISMSPLLFSGRPVVDGTGISTMIISERYKAGDSIKLLSKEYNLAHSIIEEAIRCELKKAA